jgi:hypothetical protein
MRKPKNLGRQALNKRSGRPRLKACDAQNLGHNCPHVVGFPIRKEGVQRPDLYEPELNPVYAAMLDHQVDF